MSPYLLSENYLLREATLGDIDRIHAICEMKDFAGGEAIVSAQTKDQDLMIVLEGRVRVETLQGDLIGEFRQGAMIGEISFLDGKERTANVFAVGPVKMVTHSRSSVARGHEREPEAGGRHSAECCARALPAITRGQPTNRVSIGTALKH